MASKLGVDDVRFGVSTQLYLQAMRRHAAASRSVRELHAKTHQDEQLSIRK
jgi:hypothetical protein